MSVLVSLVTKEMAESAEVCIYVYLFFLLTQNYLTIHSLEIDECASDTDNCDINADCINTGGSFQCVCREGYDGNGLVCTGV